jgi:hypothetical protein
MFKPTAKPAKGSHGPMHTKGAAAPTKVGKGTGKVAVKPVHMKGAAKPTQFMKAPGGKKGA